MKDADTVCILQTPFLYNLHLNMHQHLSASLSPVINKWTRLAKGLTKCLNSARNHISNHKKSMLLSTFKISECVNYLRHRTLIAVLTDDGSILQPAAALYWRSWSAKQWTLDHTGHKVLHNVIQCQDEFLPTKQKLTIVTLSVEKVYR